MHTLKLRMFIAVVLIACVSIVSAQSVTIARGDAVWTEQSTPGGTCWLFPANGVGDPRFYDYPSKLEENKTWCNIYGEDTANLKEDMYYLVYQSPVLVNGIPFKDVTWDNGTLISAIKRSENIDERGAVASKVKNDLVSIVEQNGFNSISTDLLFVQNPSITINRIERTNSEVYTISGYSNLENGTEVKIYIDEMRYFAQHNSSFSYSTSVVRNRVENASLGVWSKDMVMPIEDMPPGWHDVTVYADQTVATVQFKVDQQKWEPAATPTEYVNYLSSGNIAPVTIVVTVLQTPEIIYQDRWHTATPTPEITDALGGTVNYPYTTGDAIPPSVAILSLICMGAFVLLKGWERK